MIIANANWFNVAVISVFLLLIFGCPLSWMLVRNYVKVENTENRIFAEKPELDLTQITKFPAAYTDYFNDNCPYKDLLVKSNNKLNTMLYGELGLSNVLQGKENWLFYTGTGGEDPMADYKHTNLMTEDELQKAAQNLSNAKKYLSEKGSSLVLFIPPNKSQIYSEYMPSNIKRIGNKSKTDILVEYLRKNTDVEIVYPFEALMKAKKQNFIYYKTDTHWNNIGALVGVNELFASLGIPQYNIEKMKFRFDGKVHGDMMDMAKLTN